MQDDQSLQRGTVTEGGTFLTFTLGDEVYGMDILKVQEIRGYDAVTRIANAPDFFKGVINLRGAIVPIFDLRIRFGLGKAEYHQYTVVIIIYALGRVIGIVVDGVSEVVTLSPEQIRPAPEFGAAVDTACITGLGSVDGQMTILIDMERLMGSPDMLLAGQQERAEDPLPLSPRSAQV